MLVTPSVRILVTPSTIETADETKGASGANAETEGDKYEVFKQKYTQLRLDHTDRSKRVNEFETELVSV